MTVAIDSNDSAAAARTPLRLREPGLLRLPPGLERYTVQGGGALVLALFPGDELLIRNLEGAQRGELVVYIEGRNDAGALGVKANEPAEGLRALLTATGEEGQRLYAAVRNHGIDLAGARGLSLFARDTPAGAQEIFTAQSSCVVIICAPGAKMAIDAQDPPTDLLVLLRRARPVINPTPTLPEPLAEPRLDMRVNRATAIAYEVREGEYIQVIDVEGRQCSDFLAFDRAQLDHGNEVGLDPTVTRSRTGLVYPGPGLYAKFFGPDLKPLVEVIRDTCGRHDTFNLACFAKYYEDKGYFGHANCTDNFNLALAPMGVRSRPGWTAINFFYNTAIGAANAIYLDDSWSRPGDHVLLRAMKHLVCASSACPDDIDPTNAWNPTDVHVRVYAAKNVFRKAVAFRMTPDSEPVLTKETGFHPRTSQLTRNYTEYRGYWLPTCYTGKGPIEEYLACRERAAIMDLSPLRKFEVLGPDAETLVNHTVTRNIRRLAVGQVVYTAMCYPSGGMMDDGTVFRLGNDNFRVICGDEYFGTWMREQAGQQGWRVWVRSSTDQIANVAVQGPLSREILKDVVWTPPTQPTIAELGWFKFTIGRIGDATGIPIMVSRTGYTGELGFEVFCHPNDAPAVWDALWSAGEPHGLMPLGLSALDMLRIESGLIFAGYEFCDQTDPFEAGVGFAVPLKSKEDDFIGKQALVRRSEHPQRTLVGLELAGNEAAGHGDCVHIGRAQVGVVTSATRSPLLRKNIALCRIEIDYAAPGTGVEVGKLDGHQKRIPAQVVRFPFYDPEKTRVRA